MSAPGTPAPPEPPAAPRTRGPRAAGDPGEADPALAGALAAWASTPGPGTTGRVLAALRDARLVVPVVAALREATTAAATGLRAEKHSEMSVLTLVAPSGATALPAFLSTATLAQWRGEARPVPVSGREACQAAREGGHAAVVLEPGGAGFPVAGAALAALADGHVPVVDARGAAAPLSAREVPGGLRLAPPAEPPPADLVAALAAALAGERDVAEAYLLDAGVGDEPAALTAALVPARRLTPPEVAALAERLRRALGPRLDGTGGSAGGGGTLDVLVLGRAQRAEAAALVAPLPLGR
ncbi:MAG TPA: SseB family protein [Miltoncostaeaceae bacterium]|nr:SseB family protein [Miltoncostaeaceae bacterium]